MSFWSHIASLAIFAALAGLASSPARAQDNVTCDPLSHGLEFCWSESTFVPLPERESWYTNEGGGDGSETVLYVSLYDAPEGSLSYEAVFDWVLGQDAEMFGVSKSAYKTIETYDVEIAGLPAKQRYYHLPAGAVEGFNTSSVHSRAISITDDYVLVARTMEEGAKVPGFSHIGDSMIAFVAIRPEGGSLTTPPPAPAADTGADCDDFGFGVSFCAGATPFSPTETAGLYESERASANGTTEMLIEVEAFTEEMKQNLGEMDRATAEQVFLVGIMQDSAALVGESFEEIETVFSDQVMLDGRQATRVGWIIPTTTAAGDAYTVSRTATFRLGGDYLVMVSTHEFADSPTDQHLADLELALANITLPDGIGTAEAPAGDSCDPLGQGIALCGLANQGLDEYALVEDGVIQVAAGDTAANVLVFPYSGFTPPIDEARRFDLQRDLHRKVIDSWLDNQGIPPSKAYVGYSLKVAVGPDEEAPNALFETFSFETDAGGQQTWGFTVYLGPDYYVLMAGANGGMETSEDHFFLVEEVMRGIRLPG